LALRQHGAGWAGGQRIPVVGKGVLAMAVIRFSGMLKSSFRICGRRLCGRLGVGGLNFVKLETFQYDCKIKLE
jgi:hypothetical protein